MKEKLKKYHCAAIAIISTLIFSAYYFHVFSVNYAAPVKKFQDNFSELETILDEFLQEKVTAVKASSGEGIWQKPEKWRGINLHVYSNDSLIFWNTNQLPILRFAEIHFPGKGILHLQNGWYYAKMQVVKEQTICASLLIKRDYSYENKNLVNDFVDELCLPFSSYITFEQENGFPIYSKEGKYLFSLNPNDYQTASVPESRTLMLLLLVAITFWLLTLSQLQKMLPIKWGWTIPLGLIFLRVISLKFVWLGFMHDTEAFEPSLYGTDEWFPNFFEYLLNCLIISFVVLFVAGRLKDLLPTKFNRIFSVGLFIVSFCFWVFLIFLNKGLIENSSIPLVMEKLFSLTIYSVFALASIGVLFYVFQQLIRENIRLCFRLNVSFSFLLVLVVAAGMALAIYELTLGHRIVFAAFFPLLITLSILLSVYFENLFQRIGFGLLLLFFFSLQVAFNLGEFNRRKEKSERELYANQLATEKDIVTEVEYSNIVEELKKDEFLRKFINAPKYMGLSDFEDGLERRIFHGFWERYELGFNLFNPDHESIINKQVDKTGTYDELIRIIEKHGSPSEIDSNIFFINDYTGHYSYIIRQPIYNRDSIKMVLMCTLKSKKIPEEIGFPRLLISRKAKVFEPLQNYSIAKYYNSHLVTKYGKFNYPSSDLALNHWKNLKTGFYKSGGYSHYILKKNRKDVVVLSTKNLTYIELITAFSYLFSFYGLLLLPALYRFNLKAIFPTGFTLAFKIQLVLISLVFLSLLAFGWGSGVFVSNQYSEYTNDLIREKLNSVKSELSEKLGGERSLSVQEDGNYMEFLLQKLSKVFLTDINLYDNKGFLLAGSRAKVFNSGLLSEQMNPAAFIQMDVKDKSEFIHQESIGNLDYSSAYTAFYNKDGRLLGYLNLQHFGQQKEFENQIQQFLVAIINVFMLLLAISIVLAIFMSNWVTAPLRIIQASFSNIEFGKHNQQILYDKQDEIGALVKDYNQKLEELEFAAQQLAQNERESAWREMAKQIAHEIKNPLTPMKLTVQQLQRVYDPSDPASVQKLTKVTNSIIEQIDSLAKIANEFSSFAKMPRPNEKRVDLLPILDNVIEVFKIEGKCEFVLATSLSSCIVLADKDLMLRVFNNLVKNAIQSFSEKGEGVISISIEKQEEIFRFAFRDNGIGISKDKFSKIFVPYFTTKSTGTGLGLAMVKQIIENHRGKIDFESVENEGTTFYIELPVA